MQGKITEEDWAVNKKSQKIHLTPTVIMPYISLMAKQETLVRSFRLTPDDVKELTKFKKFVFPVWGKLTDAQAMRLILRRINVLQEQFSVDNQASLRDIS